MQKVFLLVPRKTFRLLVLTNFFPQRCKISGAYFVPVSKYWIWTKTTRQKIGFIGQIHVKFELW